jgi:hypothetical protein
MWLRYLPKTFLRSKQGKTNWEQTQLTKGKSAMAASKAVMGRIGLPPLAPRVHAAAVNRDSQTRR